MFFLILFASTTFFPHFRPASYALNSLLVANLALNTLKGLASCVRNASISPKRALLKAVVGYGPACLFLNRRKEELSWTNYQESYKPYESLLNEYSYLESERRNVDFRNRRHCSLHHPNFKGCIRKSEAIFSEIILDKVPRLIDLRDKYLPKFMHEMITEEVIEGLFQ